MGLPILDILLKKIQIIRCPLCLISFSQHNGFKVYPCYGHVSIILFILWSNNIKLYGHYPFCLTIHQLMHIGLFLYFSYYEFVWICFYFSLGYSQEQFHQEWNCSYGNTIFNFLRNYRIVPMQCSILHYHQQYIRVPVSPQHC